MRLRLLLTVCAAMGLSGVAGAQSPPPLDARLVHERTGAPIADASVSIVGLPGATRTDADGRFTWAPAPQPPFEVVVVLPGGQVTRAVVAEAQAGTAVISIGAIADA